MFKDNSDVTEDTKMSLDEFCNWARSGPEIPGDVNKTRLGWSEKFEKTFKDAVSLSTTETGIEAGNFSRDWQQTVSIWFQMMFRILMSSPAVQNVATSLNGQLSGNSNKTSNVSDGGIILPSSGNYRPPPTIRQRAEG